jgi:hypothetical protein
MRKPERSSELPQQMKEKELLRKNHFLPYIMTLNSRKVIVEPKINVEKYTKF